MDSIHGESPVIQTERVLYLDFLRIIAMIAVIVLHAASSKWYEADIHSFSWNVFNFYDSISRWAVPVFAMISGALFLDSKREISIKKLYTKHILRIITAFLFWSVVYALVSSNTHNMASFITKTVSGHYHMWYLYMIVGLYIITPLLRRITERKKETKYFLIVSFVFTFLIPFFLIVLRGTDGLLHTNGTLYTLANGIVNKINFHFAVGYSFYYVLGYFLYSIEIPKTYERIIYCLGILGFSLTVLLTKYYSLHLGEPNGTFYDSMTINVMLEAIAVFTLTKCKIAKKLSGSRQRKIIMMLSKYSFGIYLVHAGVLGVLEKAGLYTLSINPALSVPLIAFLVFVISAFISAVINKIPVVSKYIV